MSKARKFSKTIRANKTEREYEQDSFYVEVSGDLIFIYGGGCESCVSPRVMKEFVKFMKQKKVI